MNTRLLPPVSDSSKICKWTEATQTRNNQHEDFIGTHRTLLPAFPIHRSGAHFRCSTTVFAPPAEHGFPPRRSKRCRLVLGAGERIVRRPIRTRSQGGRRHAGGQRPDFGEKARPVHTPCPFGSAPPQGSRKPPLEAFAYWKYAEDIRDRGEAKSARSKP